MAYCKQIGTRYQFQIKVNNIRECRTFANKKDGQIWAARRETELLAKDSSGVVCRFTLADAIDKYIKEICVKHKGWRMEMARLRAFVREKMLPMDIPLTEIGRQDIRNFRDVRFRQVSAGTVQREMNLLSVVFEAAKTEWEWIQTNPVREVKKPPSPQHRSSVWTYGPLKRLLRELGYSPGEVSIESTNQTVALAFLLALRTGMRAGELCKLTWADVEPFYVTLKNTKNGSDRFVPLTSRARRLMEKARARHPSSVLDLKPGSLDALFRKAKCNAGLKDANLTFHDSRHTAATWLAKDLAMVDLCKMFGWRNPTYALVYYNPNPEDMAKHLDSRRQLGARRSNLDQRFSSDRGSFPSQ